MARKRKKRVKVPGAVEAEVLFDNEHTCCVCNDASKVVLLHHVNEDPSDNREENLAVVCIECSEKIHRKSVHAKGYSSSEVRLYKEHWEWSVAKKREFRAAPKITEKISEIDRATGVQRFIEREVPYLDGLAPKAFEVVPQVKLSEGQGRALEEARRLAGVSGSGDRLLFIAARLRRDEAAHASREMVLSRISLGIGDDKFRERDYASAERYYREALVYAESADEPGILAICLGELAAAVGMQGRHEQALGYLDRLLALNADEPAAWYNKGICLLALKMPKEALAASTTAIKLGRRTEAWNVVARSYLSAGVAHQESGNPKKAIESYEQAIEAGSKARDWATVARSCYNAGTASEALGRHEDAIIYCRKAIDIGSKGQDWAVAADAYGEMAQAQVALGSYLDGMESYGRAIEMAVKGREWGTVAAAYVGLAVAQSEQTQYEESIESCLQAVEFGIKAEAPRTVASGQYNMGLAQAKLGRHEEAIRSYSRGIEMGTKSDYWEAVAVSLYNMGIAHTRLGAYEQAIESFEQAINVGRRVQDWRTVASAYNNMAAAQGGLGLWSRVVDSCHEAIRMGIRVDDMGTVARAHLSMGKALAGSGRHLEAMKSYREASLLRGFLPDQGAWVFRSMVESNCILGTEAFQQRDLERGREYACAVAEIYLDARENGMGELVLEAVESFERTLPKARRRGFERFRRLVMERVGASA